MLTILYRIGCFLQVKGQPYSSFSWYIAIYIMKIRIADKAVYIDWFYTNVISLLLYHCLSWWHKCNNFGSIVYKQYLFTEITYGFSLMIVHYPLSRCHLVKVSKCHFHFRCASLLSYATFFGVNCWFGRYFRPSGRLVRNMGFFRWLFSFFWFYNQRAISCIITAFLKMIIRL